MLVSTDSEILRVGRDLIKPNPNPPLFDLSVLAACEDEEARYTKVAEMCLLELPRCVIIFLDLVEFALNISDTLATSCPEAKSVSLVIENGSTLGYARRKIAKVLGLDLSDGGHKLIICYPKRLGHSRDGETLASLGFSNKKAPIGVLIEKSW